MSNFTIARIITNRRVLFERIAKRVDIRPKPVETGGSQSSASAWRQALVRGIPQIYGLFIRHRIHPALAEELTQKTILDAVAGSKTFNKQKGTIGSWMIGIAKKNLALEMRQRAKRPKLNTDISRYFEQLDSEPLPDELLEKKETAEIVRMAMENLRDSERQVLKAKYIEDISARMIAERMDITEKAVHSLLYRARNSLREGIKNIRDVDRRTGA